MFGEFGQITDIIDLLSRHGCVEASLSSVILVGCKIAELPKDNPIASQLSRRWPNLDIWASSDTVRTVETTRKNKLVPNGFILRPDPTLLTQNYGEPRLALFQAGHRVVFEKAYLESNCRDPFKDGVTRILEKAQIDFTDMQKYSVTTGPTIGNQQHFLRPTS